MEIRKAIKSDAYSIHIAHMESIREICSRDHSEEEIKAWGNRPFSEEQRHNAIEKQFVYVVEIENKIEGFMHFNFINNEEAYVFALYFSPKCIGQDFGKQMIQILLDESKRKGIKKISLHSTLTAHSFYLKMGFLNTGAMTSVIVNTVPVRCIPMSLSL